MNIAVDIRCLMTKQLTGVGEYTLNLLKHLFAIDNTNQYYLFYNSFEDVKGNLPKFDQSNVHYVGFRWPNKLFNFCLQFLKWPNLDEMINAVILRGPAFCGTPQPDSMKEFKIDLFFFPNIIFLKTKCPYIITAHDLSFELFPELLTIKNRLWHKIINPRKLYRNAKAVLAVSNHTKNDLIKHYSLAPEKITTTLLGVHEDYKKISPEDKRLKEIKQKYNLPEKFILFLGTVEPRKNVNALIHAFEAFKTQTGSEYALVIAGKFDSATYHLPPTTYPLIKFTGFIEDSEKKYFYNLASLFVYPSFYEGFGFPPLEAMACGCPVITSNNSSLIEMCGNAALTVDAFDVNDLTTAMQEMLLNEEARKYFVEKGMENVKRFNWGKTAKDTLSVFEPFASEKTKL